MPYKPKKANRHPQVSSNQQRDTKTPWKHLKKALGVAAILAVVFLVGACTSDDNTTNVNDSAVVERYLDTDYNVVCWSNLRSGGIDCIPYSDLDPDAGANLEANP